MTPKERKLIFDKYDGKCAYCGCELSKSFHVDHLDPVMRSKKLIGYSVFDQSKIYETTMTKKQNDVIENMMPSCVSCNFYKSTYTLEQFREQIGLLVGRLNKREFIYKMAKRYGLIE